MVEQSELDACDMLSAQFKLHLPLLDPAERTDAYEVFMALAPLVALAQKRLQSAGTPYHEALTYGAIILTEMARQSRHIEDLKVQFMARPKAANHG